MWEACTWCGMAVELSVDSAGRIVLVSAKGRETGCAGNPDGGSHEPWDGAWSEEWQAYVVRCGNQAPHLAHGGEGYLCPGTDNGPAAVVAAAPTAGECADCWHRHALHGPRGCAAPACRCTEPG